MIRFCQMRLKEIMHSLSLIAAFLALGDAWVAPSGAVVIVALSFAAIIRSKMP